MLAGPDSESRPSATVAGALAVAAMLVVLLPTLRFGLGQTPDAVAYLSAAESWVEGRGLVLYDGSPYADWPPVYPLLVAFIAASGKLPVATAAWILQAAIAAAIVITAYALLLRLAPQSKLVSAGAALAVLVAPPFLAVAAFAWSELTFMALVLGFFLVLDRARERPSPANVAALTLLAGAATLTRYAGVALLPIALCVLATRQPLRAIAFAVGAALPLALWTERNLALVGAPLGRRRSEGTAVLDSLARIESTLAGWILPGIESWLWIGLPLLVTSAAIAAFRQPRLRPLAAFLLFYPVFLVVTAARAPLDPLDDRLLAPLAVPWLIVLAILLASCPRRVAVGVAALWAAVALAAAVPEVALRMQAGPGGYLALPWRGLGLDEALRALEREQSLPIYSNAPDALWALTGRNASFTPWRSSSPRPATRIPGRSWPSGRFHVVWFESVDRPYLLALEDLRPLLGLRAEARFRAGSIHRGERVEVAAER